MECSQFFVYPFVIFLVIYLFFKWKFTYWRNRGIPTLIPHFPYGNMPINDTRHTKDIIGEVYHTFKKDSPIAGMYVAFSPVAVATDLDLIKSILIKNFSQFSDRRSYYNEKDDPLSAHMFSLNGEKWRNLRQKLSPTFTSGKMKYMFSTVVDVADYLAKALRDAVKFGPEIEIKEYMGRFTTDVIGQCAFGIECNSLKDPNAEFRQKSRKAFGEPLRGRFMTNIVRQFPELSRKLHVKVFDDDVTKFFLGAVRETVAYREENNIRRNDFMDLLIELKNGPQALSIEEIAAQAFLFFLAGFETSSTTLSHALFELAHQQDIQERARKEVIDVLGKHDWVFTYEAMMEMKYLDQVINETLRMYPPVTILNRSADFDFPIPETNIVLERGTRVIIPAYAIQRDPDIFPEPDRFDPDRFHPEEMKNRHPMSFLSFGDGPRNCVGLRFGMMQTRIGLISILRNFRISPSLRSKPPLEFDKDSLLLMSKGGIYLNLESI